MTTAPNGKGAGEETPAGASEEEVVEAEAVDADLVALADVQSERDEYLALAQRARADFENFRKRAAGQVADAERRGRSGIARELVPVIDNLERALAAAPEDDPLRKGVELVHADLAAVLERGGVEAYDPAGEPFDPAFHEALAKHAVEGADSGTVVETVERGYRLDGQVIRPARVVVAE
jgi:molecular chaperone GrpE